MTIPQAFALALQHHQSGRVAEAETIYREILAEEPQHADALHLLGVLAHQAGRNDLAVELISQALALKPNYAEACCNLGTALKARGQFDAAIAAFHQAIALSPSFPEAHANLGDALRETGQLDEAIAACRRAIALLPQHPEAHRQLGHALREKGELDPAIAALRQAIALKPGLPETHSDLGEALREKGQLDEAIAACRQAIALKPSFPEACSNLGNALREQGQLDEAVAACRQAIALQPDLAEAHNNLGSALYCLGKLDEAIAAFRQAIALKPSYAGAHGNLGTALTDTGQRDEAIAAFRHALQLRANDPENHYKLGLALYNRGALPEAISAFHRCLALHPQHPEAHCDLGNALSSSGHPDAAIAAYRRAIALKPHFSEALSNLGHALREKGQLEEAIAVCRAAIDCTPHFPEAYNNLGIALKSAGRVDEAIAAYRQAIALKPDLAEAHSNLVYTLHVHPDCDARQIAEEQRRWNQQHAEPLRQFIRPHANEPDPNRRLKIGYISADFRTHSVAFFLDDLLASHDPAVVEVFCYASVAGPDAVTARLRQSVPHWREIFGLPDAQVAELIRQDGIDLLVDLAGHTAHHRLLVFARKPAPVQVTWLGYPGSTGLAAMDYRLTDALVDPPGTTEDLHSEQLHRLPDCAWCYRPSALAPPVSDLPVAHAGHLTFGCFNAQPKITPAMRELWARILLAVPGSRLLLKNSSLLDAPTRARLQHEFEQLGIGAERLELVGYAATLGEHLATYGRVDIALDTFPYHGTTTTCEALWMGVPVLTLAGKTHASRVGVSLLHTLGLSDWIATSPEEYLRLAVEHGTAVERLAALRGGLRARMMASPLMDGPRFARHVEQAFRQMWQTWCAQPSTGHTP